MKTRLMLALIPGIAFAAMTLLAGCDDESPKQPVQTSTTPVATTNAAAQSTLTNKAVVADAPSAKIAPPAVELSPAVAQVAQLAQAGVGDQVLLAYIENSTTAFEPTVSEIVYLNDIGIPVPVLEALLRHREPFSEQLAQSSVPESNKPTTAAPPPATPQNNPNQPQQPAAQTEIAATAAVVNAAPTLIPASLPVETQYVSPPQQVTYNYFYESLSPYGYWLDVPDYGWCWQPTVATVNLNWRPYSDRGRWLYTDCGWYWQSDYSWGWAPFHYGRWNRSPRHGWVWVPDTAWGPAWVSWRTSDAYCGWAPLPSGAVFEAGLGFRFHGARVGIGFDFGLSADCFTFVSHRRFADRSPWNYCLPSSQVAGIYHQTVVNNNYVVGDNNTIINAGIGRDRIMAATRSEIRKIALRDLPTNVGILGKPDRMERDGRTLAVYRPKLPAQAAEPPPHLTRRQQELPKASTIPAKAELQSSAKPGADKDLVTVIPPRVPVTSSVGARTLLAPPSNPVRIETDNRVSKVEALAKYGDGLNNQKSGPTLVPSPISGRNEASTVTKRIETRPLASPGFVSPRSQDFRPKQVGELPPKRMENRATGNTINSQLAQPPPSASPAFRQQEFLPRSISEAPTISGAPTIVSKPAPPAARERVGYPSQFTVQPQPPPQSAGPSVVSPQLYRQEPRKLEAATPNYSSPPKFNQSASAPTPTVIESRSFSSPSRQSTYVPQNNTPSAPRSQPIETRTTSPRSGNSPSFAPPPSRPQPAQSAPTQSNSRDEVKKR